MTRTPSASTCYLGTITGTSVDGLDLALIDVSDDISFLASSTTPFPIELREDLLKLGQPGTSEIDEVGELDGALGTFIGEAVNQFLLTHEIPAHDIAAIGSHGQTIRHRPDLRQPFTWQIGDPNRIAEITGVTTVADFRRRDMAAGGQGAPLVPRFHDALFRSDEEFRVIVNIGGISNVTWLAADSTFPITGFDTGPGNGLLDGWCQKHRSSPFDSGGEWAATGVLQDDLLLAMEHDPYLGKPPPKSTGREYFNLTWLNQHLIDFDYRPEDVQRTLIEYTARTILEAVGEWANPCDRLIVCGGGRANDFLMTRLRALAVCPVETSEDHGFDGDAIEAAAFAWLAWCRLHGEAGNADAVTGAKGLRVLGAVYYGASHLR